MSLRLYLWVCVCLCLYVCVSLCPYVFMSVYGCVCLCVWAEQSNSWFRAMVSNKHGGQIVAQNHNHFRRCSDNNEIMAK